MKFHYSPGATPLDPDESAGLIPTHIQTQSQLNEWEQANIAEAYQSLLQAHPALVGEVLIFQMQIKQDKPTFLH